MTALIASELPALLAELLAPARELAVDVAALDLSGEAAAEELIARGADRVLRSARAPTADAEVCAALLVAAIERVQPDVVLVGATSLGAETAARAGQRLGLSCANEAEALRLVEGALEVRRRCLGRFVATEVIARPAMATVRPRRFSPPPPLERPGVVERLDVRLPVARVRVLRSEPRPRSDQALDGAARVVSVGRGLRCAADLSLIRGLAASLDAAVGGSRPVTEHLGWLPLDLKVGLSGKTIAPELYVACGISGQIEHIVGMRDSRVVVAINSDPAAPIFEEADFYVVGDLHEVVPALRRAVEEARGRAFVDQT